MARIVSLSILSTLIVILGLTFFRPRHPRFHLLGGALMLSCTVLSFLGLRHMPVGEFTAVQF